MSHKWNGAAANLIANISCIKYKIKILCLIFSKIIVNKNPIDLNLWTKKYFTLTQGDSSIQLASIKMNVIRFNSSMDQEKNPFILESPAKILLIQILIINNTTIYI